MAFYDRFKASLDLGNNQSPFGEAGLMFDPLAHLSSDYRDFMRKTWELPNKHGGKLVAKANVYDRKINPLHKAIDKTEIGAQARELGENKPGDTALAVLGSIFGGGALMGGLGGGATGGTAGGSSNGLGIFANGGTGGLQGLGGGNAGALAQSGGISGGAGMGSATATASPSWMELVKQNGFGSMPGMSTGAPAEQQAPPPQYNPPQQIDLTSLNNRPGPNYSPTAGEKFMGGLGRLRDGLTPVDPRAQAEMTPEQTKQLRNQAMLRMGLGMMAAASQGGRFGESLAAGYNQGLGGFNKDVEGAYQRGVKAREEKREVDRLGIADQRYADELAYSRGRDQLLDTRDQRNFDANQQYRKDSLASLERRASSKAPGVTLSDEAVEFAARRLLNGEPANKVLANFGRGAQGAQNITAVQNRLAELASEGKVSPQLMAVITQELAADSRTRLELGAREGKVAARVEEAKQFAKIAGDASLKVPRGQFVPVSRLLQYTDTQLSNPELAAFKAANTSLINAYAAAVGGGVPTVHDKEAAEAMLNTAQSPEAYQAVVNQLITEMNAALAAPRNVMEEMREHDVGGDTHSAPTNNDGWSIKPVN